MYIKKLHYYQKVSCVKTKITRNEQKFYEFWVNVIKHITLKFKNGTFISHKGGICHCSDHFQN